MKPLKTSHAAISGAERERGVRARNAANLRSFRIDDATLMTTQDDGADSVPTITV